MILLAIQMNVLSEKYLELTQTIASLSCFIRMEKGCIRCVFCQSFEDENRLFLLEEWDTEENLNVHMKSEYFSVLCGATMIFLKEPFELMFFTDFHPARGKDLICKTIFLKETKETK
jgi:quinol monooxygenase YgiN